MDYLLPLRVMLSMASVRTVLILGVRVYFRIPLSVKLPLEL